MNYKIFFAYQSDIPSNLNKDFIQSAIEIAIKKLEKEGYQLTLDYGFRGTPGTPILIEEMLKKSKASDLVLVDLTFTSSKNIFFSRHSKKLTSTSLKVKKVKKDKYSSNPNVLLETGYAWSNKGYHRTLAIMNTAFGSPEDLSVDMLGFRWGITYDLDAQNYSERKSKRRILADDLYNAFKTSLNSESTYQRDKWKPLRTNKYWNDSDFHTKYFLTSELKNIIAKIRVDFEHNSTHHRITGPPKSGKTRLTREIFKEINGEFEKHELIESILYFDIDLAGYAAILNQIEDLRDYNQKKVLIIDNCPKDVHKRLAKELKDTDVRLLTIAEDQGEDELATISLSDEIKLSIIDSFIEKTANPEDRSNTFSLINKDLSNIHYFQKSGFSVKIGTKGKWEEILKEYHEKGLIILKVLSIFTHIAKRERNPQHFNLIQTIANVDEEYINNFLIFAIEKGIIAEKGDFYQVKLFRDELAASWWMDQSAESIEKALHEITIHGLSKQLGNRLTELVSKNELENQDLIKSGFSEIFTYGSLNTEDGSRLFMSMVEIAPAPLAKKISKEFSTRTTEDLLEFKEGRRNIVWALEKLCFLDETFETGARLLFQLALAENEEISNNATGQFLAIFQPKLGGTQAELKRRFNLVKDLQEEFSLSELLIDAYSRMLISSQFHRMSGPEIKLGKKLDDLDPSLEDLLGYWASAIDSLMNIDTDLKVKAEEVIVNKFHQQFVDGNRDKILEAAKVIINRHNKIPSTLHQTFSHVNMNRNISKELKDQLNEIIEQFKPNSSPELIQQYVIEAPYESQKIDGEWIDISANKARELAIDFVERKDDSWKKEIDKLQKGEQRHSYSFGEGLGGSIDNPEEILEIMVNSLKAIPAKDQKDMFLYGFIAGVGKEEFTRYAIEVLAGTPEVIHHAIRLHKYLKINAKDLMAIQRIIDISPDLIFQLEYLNFKNLNKVEFSQLLEWLQTKNEIGVWLAIGHLTDRLRM